MKTLGLTIFYSILNSMLVSAQSRFTITYNHYYNWQDTLIPTGSRHYLVIRDSVSYCYTNSVAHPQKVKRPLGSEFRSHAEFRDFKKNLLIFNNHLSGFGRLLILDSIRRIDWEYYDDEKYVSGFKCRKATGIQNGQQLTAWFTRELPAGHGPFTPLGLPGTILEVYYRNYNTTVSAIEVLETAEIVVAPAKGKPVDREKYDKYVKSIYRRPPTITVRRY
jgi:GLPGLI family protein